MKTYWSCSKFANWIRGTDKPVGETTEGWSAWEKSVKINKFRYWLAEAGLDHLQSFICWPANRIDAVRCYISNRWVVKTHALTSNLKRGIWHDLETRLLYSNFDQLVDFVETELALEFYIWTAEDRSKYKIPWHYKFSQLGFWRCEDAGVDYLAWASKLTFKEDLINKDDPRIGQPTPQAITAQEISALYTWWKIDRPNRPNPSVAGGWSAYCDEKRDTVKAKGDDPSLSIFRSDTSDDERAENISRLREKIDEAQDEEDTAMLIRLIKIRQYLWT